ncbi:MAG: hypothetical protein EBT86_00200 [Actinobacteria bacterium]|nr:hypothetical protein [Actinomycetota bacterium]NDG28211.1 hypothetical protein [Pseudomonadota bacterium]
MTDNYPLRRQLFDNLTLLVKSEQLEILKILKKNDEKYTENSNGIFFDVLLISDKSYEEMNSFMEFCLKTRKEDNIRTQTLKNIAAECGATLDRID